MSLEYYKRKSEILEETLRVCRNRIDAVLNDNMIMEGDANDPVQHLSSVLTSTPKKEMQAFTPKRVDVQSSEEIDLDETFYEPAEQEVIKVEKEVKTDKKKNKKRKRIVSPKKHVCKLPRCPDHQPFFETSVRKLNMLSPKTKKMGTTSRRTRSPKGFWSLDMPSTQEIRTRNQD